MRQRLLFISFDKPKNGFRGQQIIRRSDLAFYFLMGAFLHVGLLLRPHPKGEPIDCPLRPCLHWTCLLCMELPTKKIKARRGQCTFPLLLDNSKHKVSGEQLKLTLKTLTAAKNGGKSDSQGLKKGGKRLKKEKRIFVKSNHTWSRPSLALTNVQLQISNLQHLTHVQQWRHVWIHACIAWNLTPLGAPYILYS